MDYKDFLQSKLVKVTPSGFKPKRDLFSPNLFEFQKDIVNWSTEKGKCAIFADVGLGKTGMLLNWGKQIVEETKENVLILTPLAVAAQTVQEGLKFGIDVKKVASQSEVVKGLNVTNYEKLHHFDPNAFIGIILDESSLLKDEHSKTRNQIIDSFRNTLYKLACTATPSPNDFVELGNHAEFLGVMSIQEMKAQYFVHDGGETSKWRLKRHAEIEFWRWVSTWACFIRHPRDLGYEQIGYDLPKLHANEIIIDVPLKYTLVPSEKMTLEERRQARKDSLPDRVKACADLVNNSDKIWLVWCDLHDEGNMLEKLIKDSVQVAGRHSDDHKEKSMLDFAQGKIKRLITKGSICGHGMNWQICHNMAFVGLGDSFELYKQSLGRVHRYGQQNEVNCYIITSSAEGAVLSNINRKAKDYLRMAEEITKFTKEFVKGELQQTSALKNVYKTDTVETENYKLMLGDCVERIKEVPDNSIDYSIFSPPFSSLYVYSNSERDIGNVRSYEEFNKHFSYLAKDLFRVLKPGRLMSVHCMNLPTTKEHHGYIGIQDFRGDLIRLFLGHEAVELYNSIRHLKHRANQAQENNDLYRMEKLLESAQIIENELKQYPSDLGFIFHSEVVIWKDPVTAMQRTKSIGLLYKQLRKDSVMSRQGIPDTLLTFNKPGQNEVPVTKTFESFTVERWQRYASPVWMDINPSKTLQKESAREANDERHIAPLQLEVIERAIELWSNPGEKVFTPFLGIGSEVYQAVKMKRQGVGIELKESYYKQAVLNVKEANRQSQSGSLFDLLPDDESSIESFISASEKEEIENNVVEELPY